MSAKIQCPLCPSKMRCDNILRHITSHRKNIPDWMPQARIDFIKASKKPIIYSKGVQRGESFAVCLHCCKGVYNCDASDVEAYDTCYMHKACIAHWDDYAPLYDAPATTRRVVPPRPCAPPSPAETPIQNVVMSTDSLPTTQYEKSANCLSESTVKMLREWAQSHDEEPDWPLDDLVRSLLEYESHWREKCEQDS
jgi:hypothetical protein